MTENNGTKGLGKGNPTICRNCEKPYREIQRLPGSVDHCPKCFEKLMNGEIDQTENEKEVFLLGD
jgi:predicted amidophosphoribosyltransferase